MKIKTYAVIISMLFGLAFVSGQDVDYDKYPLSIIPYPGPGKQAPDSGDLISALDNVKINSDNTTQLQNEEMVCINPLDTDNAVAVWRDFRLGYRRIGVGYTFDGGETWNDYLLTPYPPYTRQSDPILWVDRNGTFYLSGLDLYPGDGPSGISVYKSTDGGMTWSDPVWAIQEQPAYFEDKQWFGMDQTGGPGDGNIYCAWDRFSSNYSYTGIFCVTSTDGGLSFGDPVSVSAYATYYVQWPTVTSGNDGTVFIAWYDNRLPRRISMATSTDFGQSFNPEFTVTELDSASSDLNGGIRSFPFAAMSYDYFDDSPYQGSLHIFYSDGGYDWDIWAIKSTDNGVSWSDKIRVNDDTQYNGADQFHPWISIDNDGVIHVCFFDRRDDADNNLLYNLYYTRSYDGGETWEVNHRISTVSSDPANANLAGLLGEYIGLSAWNGEVQMVWTDVRDFNQDVYSARISSSFIIGDINNNDKLSTADVTFLVNYYRGINPVPDPPIWRSDNNGDCEVNLADLTYLVQYFKGEGSAPVNGDCP